MEIFIPDILTKAESYAFKALHDGKANEHQQKAVLIAIMRNICGIQDIAFDPANQFQTAFNEGKRVAAITITKAIQFDWDRYEKRKKTTKPKPLLTTK